MRRGQEDMKDILTTGDAIVLKRYRLATVVFWYFGLTVLMRVNAVVPKHVKNLIRGSD